MLAATALMAALLQTCAQIGQVQCAQVLICNSENAFQNEDWPLVFILILANCLGQILILDTYLLIIYYFLWPTSSLGG